MKRSEIQQLEVGTVLYNGHTEGVVKMDGNIKVIEVLIQVSTMSNNSPHPDERPDNWEVLD